MKSFIEIFTKLNLLTVAHAESIEDTPVKLESVQNNTFSTVTSLFIFMATFIIITGLLAFLFIVISKKNKLEQTGNKSIRVLDTIKMDHNSNIFVLKIQDEVHILGKTENALTSITTIAEKDKVQQIELDCEKNQEQNFQAIFNEQINSTSAYIKNFKSSSNVSKSFKINTKNKEL